MTLANILKNRRKYLSLKYTCEWNTHLHVDKCALNVCYLPLGICPGPPAWMIWTQHPLLGYIWSVVASIQELSLLYRHGGLYWPQKTQVWIHQAKTPRHRNELTTCIRKHTQEFEKIHHKTDEVLHLHVYIS